MPWSGAALARMREALGYSGNGGQAAAAKKSGRAATQLSEWEGDATRPRVDVLVAYVESLGGSMHDLADALDQVNGRSPRDRPPARRDLDISRPPEREMMLTAPLADEIGAAVGAAVAAVLERRRPPSD